MCYAPLADDSLQGLGVINHNAIAQDLEVNHAECGPVADCLSGSRPCSLPYAVQGASHHITVN